MAERVYLAIDLGAESGRIMAGLWNGKTISLDEVHRFPNTPVPIAGSNRWNIPGIWLEIQNGLARAADKFGSNIVSAGADTWGVDYVLLDKKNELLGLPYHYRDSRTQGIMDEAFDTVPRRKIFEQTGLQFMELNTLYQLLSVKKHNPALLEATDCLLFTPDFIHWCLCGSRLAEFTIASTSQCLNPVERDWARDLINDFGLPTQIFPKIIPPGSNLGSLRPSVSKSTGLKNIKTIAPPSHDTASAVTGIPTANTGKPNWAYISSGTWSLMGAEISTANLSELTLELNLTNEGGIDGTFRLLKNIMGLWLIQQCKRAFDAAGDSHTYPELEQMADETPALRSIVNPNDPRFLNPTDMPKAIQEYCSETGQPVPQTKGELVRCATDSLALMYMTTLQSLEQLTGNTMEVIHIVGGGSKNIMLNRMTANACRRPVIAGPIEATAMGNLLVQVRADGELGSLSEMREVIRASSEVTEYEPGDGTEWENALARFEQLRNRS